jgi:endoglucanase
MLTLAAMHVLYETSDPFFTRLQAGAFAAKKPGGKPCDAASKCHGLPTGAIIALQFVGFFICFLLFKYRKSICNC